MNGDDYQALKPTQPYVPKALRASHFGRRKEIYETLNPQTEHGGDRRKFREVASEIGAQTK